MMQLNWQITGMRSMENRVLIDTNVLLDYLLMREPFFESAKEIMQLCSDCKIQACIAAHSISNMFFILRKSYTVSERRKILIQLVNMFDVEGIDKNKLVAGLENDSFSDFEDCLQMECAKSFGANYIITRNVDDYETSDIKAITPAEYLELR